MTHPLATPTSLSKLPTNADIKLVAVDMDGTLLGDDKKIPEQLWDFLDELREAGVVFAPSSGRQCWTLIDMFDRVSDGMTVIAENGAIVMRDGIEISSVPMDHTTVAAVIRGVREVVAEGANAGLMMCGKKSGYVERHDQPFLDAVAPYYHRTLPVESQLDVLEQMERGELDDDVIKLALFCFDDVLPAAGKTLARFADTHQYVVSGHNWADLQAPGVDKGTAVRALQEYLGVTREQTLAFGDFHNDLGMLAEAGWNFAMANAHQDVLDAAEYVAPSNNDGGVFTVTRHLLGLG